MKTHRLLCIIFSCFIFVSCVIDNRSGSHGGRECSYCGGKGYIKESYFGGLFIQYSNCYFCEMMKPTKSSIAMPEQEEEDEAYSTNNTYDEDVEDGYNDESAGPEYGDCVWCSGSGECWVCDGTGKQDYGDYWSVCGTCMGSAICTQCHGAGQVIVAF